MYASLERLYADKPLFLLLLKSLVSTGASLSRATSLYSPPFRQRPLPSELCGQPDTYEGF